MYIARPLKSKVLRLAALGWSLGLSLTLPLQALAADGLDGQDGLNGLDAVTDGAYGRHGTAGTEGGNGGRGGNGGSGFQPASPGEDSSSGGGRGGDGGRGGQGTPALSPDADGINASDSDIRGTDGGYGGSGGDGGRAGNGGSGNARQCDKDGNCGLSYAPGDGGDALGRGGDGGNGGDGGQGGAGLNLETSVNYINEGTITGGNGGQAGSGGQGGNGGRGGYGVTSPAHQGSGGDSRSDGGDGGRGGDAGDGGQGALITADRVSLSNQGSIVGGSGGDSGYGGGGYGGRGGDGGDGNNGYQFNSYHDDLYTPGWSGPPPDGGDSYSNGGDGGRGGDAGRGGHGVEVLGRAVVLNNSGLLQGGHGHSMMGGWAVGGQNGWGGYSGSLGAGSYGEYGDIFGEYGKNGEVGLPSRGGAGLRLGGDLALTTNTGTIEGGGSYAAYYDDIFGDGGPGVLIDGNENRFINSGAGRVGGGLNGDRTVQAEAVLVTGRGNTVELRIGRDDAPDYGFDGQVLSLGSGNILALGSELGETGDVSRYFDLAAIGSRFVGFDGFDKTGEASWVLAGHTADDKPWTISGGLLSVGSADALGRPDQFAALGDSRVSVLRNGLLAVYGQIGTVANRRAEVLVQAGGALFAGVGGYIFGDLCMAENSILLAANRNEALTVTGATDLAAGDSAKLDVRLTGVPGGVWEQGKTYQLIKASDVNQLAGFQDVEVSGPLVDYVIGRDSADPNLLVLTVRETHGYDPGVPSTPSVPSAPDTPSKPDVPSDPGDTDRPRGGRPLTPNQSEAARGLNSLNPSSPVYQGLIGVAPEKFPWVLDRISGEIHSTIAGILASQGENFLDRLGGRARSRWDDRLSTWKNLWANVGGSHTFLRGDYNTARGLIGGAEASIGYDAAWKGGWSGGLALRFSQLDVDLHERASDGDLESLMLAAHLGRQFRLENGRLRVSLGMAVGRHDVSTSRRPMGEGLEADYNAFSQHYAFRAGYRVGVRPGLDLEPSLKFDYGHYRNDRIEETGGHFALRASGGQNNELFSGTLGLTAYHQLSETADITVGLGWRNRLKNNDGQLNLAFDGSDEFAIRGAPLGRNTAVVSVGLESRLSDNWTASLDYQGNFASECVGNAGFATLAWVVSIFYKTPRWLLMPVSPVLTDTYSVAFACDDAYAPILSVAIQSLLDHASPGREYEIIILWPDARGSAAPPAPAQKALLAQAAGRENVSVRFVDMAAWLAAWGHAGKLPIRPGDHVSVACYYRLFLPSILSDYHRVIYLDVDLILQTDVAELWDENLGGAALGAVRDVWAVNVMRNPHPRYLDWIRYLGLDSPDGYFNSGVMIFDLNRMRVERIEERCLNRLIRFPPRGLHDQDVLNAVCQHYIAHQHPAWNCLAWWEQIHHNPQVAETLAPDLLREYRAAALRPRIIHYLNRRKPWQAPWRDKPLAAPFREIARRTPFAEELESWPERTER